MPRHLMQGYSIYRSDKTVLAEGDRRLAVFGFDVRDIPLAEIAARMIDRIPRLGGVAEILRLQTQGDGRIQPSNGSRQTSATLLRVAFYWELLSKNGVPPSTAVSEIQFALPELSSRVANALSGLEPGSEDDAIQQICADDLEEGMVLVEDVIADSGALLVSSGRRLTRPIVEKLQQYASAAGESVTFAIAAVSCPRREPTPA